MKTSRHNAPSHISRRTKLRLAVAACAVVIVGIATIFVPRASAANLSSVVEKSRLEAVYQCYTSGKMNSPLTSKTWDGLFSMVSFTAAIYPIFEDNALGAKYVTCDDLFRDYYISKFPSKSASVSTLDTFFKDMGYTIISDASTGRCATYNFKNKDNEKSYVQMCAADIQDGVIKSDKMEITYSDSIAEVVEFGSKKGQISLDCKIGYWFGYIGTGGCGTHKFSDYNDNFESFANGIFSDISNAIAKGGGDISRGSWDFDGDLVFTNYSESNKTYRIDNNAAAAANSAIKYLSDERYKNHTQLALTTSEKQDLLLNYIREYYGINYYLGSESSACNLSGDALSRAQATTEYKPVNFSTNQTCFIAAADHRGEDVPTYNSDSYPDGTPRDFAWIIEELNRLIVVGTQDAKGQCTTNAERDLATAMDIVDKALMGMATSEQAERAQQTVDEINKIKRDHGQYWYEENGAVICYEYTKPDGSASSTDPGYTPPTTDDLEGANGGNDEGGQAATDPCYSAGASLGWIICPTLDIVGKAVVGIYDIVIQPFLEIKSEWLSNGKNSVYGGWKQFRDFANILFAIGFVVIILAQVTGIGISNYNIKKILPRLIMVVVLVNLSYVICQMAVDISNILGSSLQNLFNSMAMKVDAPSGVGDVEMYGGGGTATWFSLSGLLSSGLTIVLGGVTIWGLAVTWEFWLIPFLLTVLGCAISVLFFFIILGVRQAGVLILTALAPVAIVCYALPNTKTFFDKWKKMYTGLLVVYPICGAMIGGGQFASALLITAGGGSNFFYNLVAMLIQVVPFFFIPTILKSSMAAMGNLGMKISGIGRQVGGFARKTVGNARPVQEKQREWARNNNQRRDMKLANRLSKDALEASEKVRGFETRIKNGEKLSVADRLAYRNAKSLVYRSNQARRRYESSIMEDAAAATGASRELLAPGTKRYESYMEGLESAQRVKDAADQRKLYEAGRVDGVNAGKITAPGVDDVTDSRNADSLAREHWDLLRAVRDNPENAEARAKLEAVQDMLAERGDKGHEAMFRNYEKMATDSTDEQLGSVGLRNAANHLSKYAPQIKKGNRSFDKLLNQYQAGTVDNYRNAATAAGKSLSDYMSDSSALGYNASSFNDMNEDAIERYTQMAKAGKLDANALQHLTKIANEALNNDQIQLKGDVEKQLHEFLSAAYGTGAVGHSTLAKGAATAGSTAMGNASVESLNSIAQRIQDGTLGGTAATNLVENARRYMESGDVISADRAQALRKIISAAQAQGVSTIDGGADNFSYDETSFKVHGAKAKASLGSWARDPHGVWQDFKNPLAPVRLNPTQVKQAEEIEKYINQQDIESGKYS